MASNLVLGLQDMEAYRDDKIAQVGYTVMREKAEEAIRLYNEMVQRFLDNVVTRNPAWNTSPINRYELPIVRAMQDVDEDGKATPVTKRPFYDMGLPLMRGELAEGWTWERARVITVEDVNRRLLQMMQADRLWMLNKIKQALFYNVGWTFNSHEEDRDIPAEIPILPLANGDTRQYVKRDGGTLTTRQNYTAQAGAVSDAADPFPTIYDQLNDMAGATGRYVAFVNGSTLINGITGLTDFVPVNRSRFINLSNQQDTLAQAALNELYFGDEVLGEHLSGVTIVRWHSLPENYIVAMDMGLRPIGMREKAEAELQGVFTLDAVGHFGNEWLSRFRRIAGFGVVNPVGALIHRTSNGSYAVPTGYTPKF